MHVIIEGADGSGKTWLANELSRRLGMHLSFRVGDVPGRVETIDRREMLREVFASLSQTPGAILDRSWTSELVYGPLKRGGSKLTPEDVAAVEYYCRAVGTFNVFCARAVWQASESFVTRQEWEKVAERYSQVIGDSTLFWHRYQMGDEIGNLVAAARWELKV